MDDEEYILDLIQRPRRLRKSHAIRAMTQENWLRPEDLVQPLFIIDGKGQPKPIKAMPGVKRFTLDHLIRECEQLSALDIRAVDLFPSMLPASIKNPQGKEALNPKGLVVRAIKAIKKHTPELSVITDVALDPYTTHGHDGVLNKRGTDVDNDRTVEILCEIALLHAEAGADFVAPSDMMDGRIGAIRGVLDDNGFTNVGIISYSAKFNSAYYGPFREAVGSSANAATGTLSKHTYQLNPANRREALIEADLDEAEGADILMVKPAGPYLDILREVKDNTNLPVAAYQVSGEYSQIQAMAIKGWGDLNRLRDESLLAIKRAGADMIFTYFAKEQAELLKKKL